VQFFFLGKKKLSVPTDREEKGGKSNLFSFYLEERRKWGTLLGINRREEREGVEDNLLFNYLPEKRREKKFRKIVRSREKEKKRGGQSLLSFFEEGGREGGEKAVCQ